MINFITNLSRKTKLTNPKREFIIVIKNKIKEDELVKTLETNDWMILNSIIYKIYTTEDVTVMRTALLEQLKMIMDFDSADFYLAAADGSGRLVDQVTYNCDEDARPNTVNLITAAALCIVARVWFTVKQILYLMRNVCRRNITEKSTNQTAGTIHCR